MRNFHVPLPDETYDRLRSAAEHSKMPATALAREAIEFWLRQLWRKERYEAISAFAAEAAGSFLDLDEELEAAGIEQLANNNKDSK